jgi:hypothetical protein
VHCKDTKCVMNTFTPRFTGNTPATYH